MLSFPVTDDFLEALCHICALEQDFIGHWGGRRGETDMFGLFLLILLLLWLNCSYDHSEMAQKCKQAATHDRLVWWGWPHNEFSSCCSFLVVWFCALWLVYNCGCSQISKWRGEAWNCSFQQTHFILALKVFYLEILSWKATSTTTLQIKLESKDQVHSPQSASGISWMFSCP